MRKISLLFAIVYSCALVNPLFAEVNIELLEQKYPKCENENFRHECFDVNLFSNAKKVFSLVQNLCPRPTEIPAIGLSLDVRDWLVELGRVSFSVSLNSTKPAKMPKIPKVSTV